MAASRDKGCPVKELVEPPPVVEKNAMPVKRLISYHRPGYNYQGELWPPEHNEEEDEAIVQHLIDMGQIWGQGGKGEIRNTKKAAVAKVEVAVEQEVAGEEHEEKTVEPVMNLEEMKKQEDLMMARINNEIKDDEDNKTKENVMMARINNEIKNDEDNETMYMSQVKQTNVEDKKRAIQSVGKPTWKKMSWKERSTVLEGLLHGSGVSGVSGGSKVKIGIKSTPAPAPTPVPLLNTATIKSTPVPNMKEEAPTPTPATPRLDKEGTGGTSNNDGEKEGVERSKSKSKKSKKKKKMKKSKSSKVAPAESVDT